MITGLDHVQVAAPPSSESEARAFYGRLLGLEEVPKPEGVRATGGVWFRAGAQELHVGVTDAFTPAAKAHPALAVASARALDELAERLIGAGAPVRWDERIAGVRRFYTDDPWGNRLELCVPSGA